MKKIVVTLMVVSLCSALALPSLAAIHQPTAMTTPGNMFVDSTRATATVVSVNQANRTVTLRLSNGTTRTYKVEKSFDLSKIKAGDRINAVLADILAISVNKAGGRPTATQTTSVMLMPRGAGAGHGAIVANTYTVTAKVQLVNQRNHTVTVTWPDNTSRAVKVTSGVNLSGLRAGDNVVIRYTEALAMNITKPTR